MFSSSLFYSFKIVFDFRLLDLQLAPLCPALLEILSSSKLTQGTEDLLSYHCCCVASHSGKIAVV